MFEHRDGTTLMSKETILKAARNEERELLQNLWQTRGFQMLTAVRQVIAAYGEAPINPFAEDVPHWALDKSKTTRIVQAAKLYLAEHDDYVRTPEIRQALEAQGIEIGGQNPDTNLSSYLSQSDKFIAERGKGWKLKPPDETEAPAATGAPENAP